MDLGEWVIGGFFIALAVMGFVSFYWLRRCPRCGAFFSRETISAGRFRCKKCGHWWVGKNSESGLL